MALPRELFKLYLARILPTPMVTANSELNPVTLSGNPLRLVGFVQQFGNVGL